MSDNTRAKILRAIRARLAAYGVHKDESITAAIDRLTDEHKQMSTHSTVVQAENLVLRRERDQALRDRDQAQAQAAQSERSQHAAEEDRAAVRNALDMLLPLLPPAAQVAVSVKAGGCSLARQFLRDESKPAAPAPPNDSANDGASQR